MIEENREQFFAGGYYWGKESKLNDFINGGYWQIGWDKNEEDRFAQLAYNIIRRINVGDKIAIKGLGGKHDLTIYAIGEVIDVKDRESGKIKVNWNIRERDRLYTGKAPRGEGAGNWRSILLQVTRPDDIESIFRDNLKPKLRSVTIENYKAIEKITMQVLENQNEVYFLGENGDGKTLILQGIILSIYKDFVTKGEVIPSLSILNKILKPDNNEEDFKIPDFRIESQSGKSFKNYNSVFAYGTNRGRTANVENFDDYGIMNLFDNTINLKNPIEWLLELDRLKQYENPPTRLHIVVTMLQDLLGKFTDTNENVKIEIREEIRFFERGSNVQFNELSDGYKTVISWVCDLLFHLSVAQPMVSDIKDYQGIVLVDEIDLHLHPKWAFSIVKKLRTWFPNIQFFFTTHSPIVILGASEDSVIYKVYKEEGVTKISEPYYTKDFSNAMANIIITSPLFDLETAAMKINSKDFDTNDSSLHSKIYKKVSEYMDEKRKQGKKLFTDAEVDQLINEALELSKGEGV